MHPEHTSSETHRGRGYLPDPSTPQVQGRRLIKPTKESQEDGILRTWGKRCLDFFWNEQRKDSPCREQAQQKDSYRACSISQERCVISLMPIGKWGLINYF